MAGTLSHKFLRHDGLTRDYYLYTPRRLTGRRPLLLALHGGGGSAEQIMFNPTRLYNYRFHELADKHRFSVLYPNGYDGNWNDGRGGTFTQALALNLDDVGLIQRMVQQVRQECLCDERKLYVTGLSNGGTFTLRLIQESVVPWAAAAISIASLPVERDAGYALARRLPVMVMVGTADPLIVYEGGASAVVPEAGSVIGVDALVTKLVGLNGANPTPNDAVSIPNIVTTDSAAAGEQTWPALSGGRSVTLCKILNGGHTIPNTNLVRPAGTEWLGACCEDFDGNEYIWSYLSQWIRPL
jgi:polyhydroxybutyrate depolymerase